MDLLIIPMLVKRWRLSEVAGQVGKKKQPEEEEVEDEREREIERD